MYVCTGRKQTLVEIASSAIDPAGKIRLLADNSMKDGNRFPICQLMVPRVCCPTLSIKHHPANTNYFFN